MLHVDALREGGKLQRSVVNRPPVLQPLELDVLVERDVVRLAELVLDDVLVDFLVLEEERGHSLLLCVALVQVLQVLGPLVVLGACVDGEALLPLLAIIVVGVAGRARDHHRCFWC